MPTFPSPVTVSQLQTYLHDISTDPSILAFYGSLLNTATEKVYAYLDRDYTPNAIKADVFFGGGEQIHRMQYPAGSFISWKYYDEHGAETVANTGDIALLANRKQSIEVFGVVGVLHRDVVVRKQHRIKVEAFEAAPVGSGNL